MGLTKRQILDEALSEIGVGMTYSVQERVLASCLNKLEIMMSSWLVDMPPLRYRLRDDLNDNAYDIDSNLPSVANNAVIKNLAKSLCSQFGKEPRSDLKVESAKLHSDLKLYFLPKKIPYATDPRMIRGAGSIYSQTTMVPFMNGTSSDEGCKCG